MFVLSAKFARCVIASSLLASVFVSAETAEAASYKCNVNFMFHKTCRYRWYEDLFRAICGGEHVDKDRKVTVDANTASEACDKAKDEISSRYPKSYYTSKECTLPNPFGGLVAADAHCVETVDMSKAKCSCDLVPVNVVPNAVPSDEEVTANEGDLGEQGEVDAWQDIDDVIDAVIEDIDPRSVDPLSAEPLGIEPLSLEPQAVIPNAAP